MMEFCPRFFYVYAAGCAPSRTAKKFNDKTFEIMKKRLFLALTVTVCAVGAFLVSCDKDDDKGTACTCINWSDDKDRELAFNTGNYGVSDCDDLADVLSEKGGNYECW